MANKNKNEIPKFMLKNNGVDSGKANAYSAQKFAENFVKGFPGYRPAVVTKDDSGNVVQYSGWSPEAKEQQEYNKRVDAEREDAEKNAKPIEWASEEEKNNAVNAAMALFKSASNSVKKDNLTTFEVTTRLENAEEQWTDDKLGHILPYSTEKEIIDDNNALSTKLQLLWQKQYDGTATDEDYSDVAKYSKVLKARQQKLKEAFDKVESFRKERGNYFDALRSGRNPLRNGVYEWEADAITSDDGKIRYQNQVRTEFDNLWGKISGGTATDDDYRRYVTLEANYGVGLQKGLDALLDKFPDYHVSSVVDSWDKYGIPESEIWKDEEAYKVDAEKFGKAYNESFEKYAKGELSEAELTALGNEYKQFKAKEEAFLSDRYQKTGTLATADALKLRRDAARDANAGTDARIKAINMEIANARRGSPEYYNGLFAEKEALENSKTNVDYKDTEGKYYSALQFEAEKADEDNYNKYVEDYTANVPDSILNLNPEQVEDKLYEYTGSLVTPVTAELVDYGTDDELKTYLYLFEKYGKETADNYARSAKYVLNKRVAEEHSNKYENSNALGRFGMGVGAVFEGGIGDIGQSIVGVGKALTGDTSYTHRNTAQQKSDAVIEAEQNPVADILMQGGRSAVANSPAIIVGIATGGSSLASTSVLFASAAGSAYVDAINKGNGYFNALGYGIANGAIEAATEKLFDIPGFYGGSKVDDAFKGIISKGVSKLSMGTKGKTALNFLGYMTANGFGEAVEEGITAAVEPTLGNIFLGEKNELFTAEHFGEIGYAALLGTVSSFLMPLSYVSTYADAKGDTAVQAIFNGEKITDKQIDAVVGNESSRTLFEKIMGFELSENKDIAKAQVVAIANSISATKVKVSDADVKAFIKDIDADNVVSYAEKVSEYIAEPDTEYVIAETDAVKEMVGKADAMLAAESENVVDRVINGTASSRQMHEVAETDSLKAEFAEKTGITLSNVPGEARNQIRNYVAERKSAEAARFNSGVSSNSDTVVLIPPNNDGKIITTTMGEFRRMPGIDGYTVFNRSNSRQIGTVVDIGSAVNAINGANTSLLNTDRIALIGNNGDVKGITAGELIATVADGKYDGYDVFDSSESKRIGTVNSGRVVEKTHTVDEMVDKTVDKTENAVDTTGMTPSEAITAVAESTAEGTVRAMEEEVSPAPATVSGNDIISAEDDVELSEESNDGKSAKIMSKDEFDTIRNNSYSITRSTDKVLDNNPVFDDVDAKDVRAFRAVGKVLGVEVKAFDGKALGLTGTDGAYDPKTRTIYLNVTSPLKAISSAFRHEVIHYLKASSPKAYGEFATFVIDKYKEQYSNEDYNAWLEAKRKEYEAMRTTLTRDDAEEEFLAQFGMDMLQQKAIARDFVRHHRNAALKIWDAIRNLINKIRRFYGMQELPTSVYDAVSQLAENTSGQVQVYGDSYTRSHLRGSKELLPGELKIDALNAADEALLNAFVEVANINKSIQAKLKSAPADVLNDDVKRAQYIEKLWAEETGVESDGNADVKFAAKPSSKNPEALDPRTVTEDDVRELLENVKNGEYYDDTYIPIRISTPLILIEWAKRRNNDVIDNNPIVISAGKAYQAMARKGADIDGTPHELSVDDMISIIKSMADPEYIVYQKNGRYVEVVAYNTEDGKNAFAVLEMGDYKDAPYMNGYEGGLYNVLVTTFSPNAGKLNELLSSNKVKYDKKKEASRGTSSSTVLSVSNDTPFYEDSISENEPSVNTSDEKKSLAKVDNGGGVIYKGGKAVAYNEGDGSVKFSLSTYAKDGKAALRSFLDGEVANNRLTKEDADSVAKELDEYYEICRNFTNKYASFSKWSDAAVTIDDNGDPVFSVVKQNGEYPMNLDFSLVCKKRRTLDAVLDEIVKSGYADKINLGKEQIVRINEMIREAGFETSCALCFVDAKRFRQADVADSFANMYNALVRSMVKGKDIGIKHFNFGGVRTLSDVGGVTLDSMSDSDLDFTAINKAINDNPKSVKGKIAKYLLENPSGRKLVNRGDFLSSKAFENLKVQNPEVLKLYNSKKGSGGPKAAFGDVQYLNEVIADSTFNAEDAYAVGGVRVQSFSDYIARLVFDYMQMTADLAAKKLPAHLYTKEELCVKQFGLAGIKINMSGIPAVTDGGIAAGLDADGNYTWADESFDYETAIEIQNDAEYGKNCGLVVVGASDAHIRKLMADDNIRMIIPYHKSGLNPIVAKMTGIDGFTNYTTEQNVRYAKGEKKGKKISAEEMKTVPSFNDALQHTDPKSAAEQHVRWCEDNGYLPKFDRFAYKVDANGKYVLDVNGRRVVDDNYYKLLTDFAVYDSDGNYHKQSAVTMTFPDENSAFGSMSALIEEGLNEDDVLEGKRDAAVPELAKKVVNEMSDSGVKFSKAAVTPAEDAEYLELAKNPEKNDAKLDSMVRDAAQKRGWTPEHLYHGTNSFGFTETDTSNSDDRISFFVSDNFDVASGYMSWYEDDLSDKYHENPRKIGVPKSSRTLSNKQDIETILNTVKSKYPEYQNAKSASDEELLEYFKRYQIPEMVSAAEALKDIDIELASDKVKKQVKEMCEAIIQANNKNTFDAWRNLAKRYDEFDSIDIPYNGNDMRPNMLHSYILHLKDIKRYVDRTPIIYDGGVAKALTTKEAIVDRYNDSFGGERIGVYDLYANHNNQLFIRGNGSVWNSIPLGKIEKDFNEWRVKEKNSSPLTHATTRQIAEFAKAKGYRSVCFEDIYDAGAYGNRSDLSTVYAFFYPESDIKSADPVTYDDDGNIIPLSERFNDEKNDIRWSKSSPDSSDTAYIPKGEKPARDIDVSAFDDEGKPVSFGARTVLEAKVTPDKFVSHVLEELARGRYSHEVITDEDALSYVDGYMADHSYWEAYDRIVSTKGVLDKNDTALAMHLYNEAVNNVDFLNKLDEDGVARVDKLLSKMIRSSSEAGRTLQAQRLLKKMTPQGLLWDITNTVQHITDDMNRELGKWVETENDGIIEGKRVKTKAEVSSVSEANYDKFLGKPLKGRKWSKNQKPLKINSELRAKLLNAKSENEAMEVYDEILNDLALQIDSTVSDELRAWRYMAMLANPRTHIRNIIGNAIFAAGINARNLQASLLEPIFVKKEDRRNALVLTKEAREKQRKLRNYAESIFETYENQIKGESRYGESLPGMLDERRVIFQGKYLGKVLEGISKKNSAALEAEDLWFLKGRFTKTFANAAFARGYNLADISSGKVTDTQVNELIRYAAMEAQKATYRDASKLASILNKVSREHAIGGFILDGVVPFKKTPINIVKRGIEYSPVSIIRGLGKLGKQTYEYKTGKSEYIDSAEIIKLITQGTTGTGLLALGYFLAQMGILKGGDEEEDKLNDLKDARGEQTYSIELGGYSFTIDWAAPLVMPFFVGAELAGGSDDDADVLSAIGNLATPVLDTSMMSGIMDLIDTVKYSEGGDVFTDLGASIMSSYALQYVPSFTAAIARTIDEVDSRGSVTDKTGTGGVLDKFMRKLANKSIIARKFFKEYNAPYTDTFGGYKKKETAGDKALSVLQNFILPGYISEVSDTATTEHMMQLFDSTAKLDMVPGYVNKITVNGESRKLTGNEIFAYKTLRGEHYSEIIPLLTSAEWYNALEDDMKVTVLTSFKELVDSDCKHMIDDNYLPTSKREQGVIKLGFKTEDVVTYLQGEVINELAVDGKDNTKRQIILDFDISDEEKTELYFDLFGDVDLKEQKKVWAFTDEGLTIDDYLEARIKKYEIDDMTDKNAGEKASEFYSWARSAFGDAKAEVVYNTLPVSTGHKIEMSDVGAYKYADAGISAEKTDKIIDAISGLEPIKGADEVSDRQKIAAIDSVKGLTDEEKFKAYDLVFPKTSKEGDKLKYLTLNSTTEGFKSDYYFEMKEIGDRINKNNEVKTEKASGSGVSQDEITAAINELAKKHPKLTRADKGMLWQMYTGSSSTKNNPYDKNAGQKYLDSKK